MLRFLGTRVARIVAIVAAVVGLYALAGFVIAPKILRAKLLEEIPKTLNVTPSVGEIHINPFRFELDVRNFALADHGGAKLLGFDRLFVGFDFSSLWHRAYTFSHIELDAPVLNAVVAPDGVINLMALKPKPSPPPARPPAKSSPLPGVRIASFKVTQGSVSYEDRSRPSLFAARIEPITFELKDFTTGVAGGLFMFTGASKLGERVEWHGHLSLQPVSSEGELHIEGLKARTLWTYLEDQLNFVVASGTIDVQSTYKFSLTDQVNMALNVSKATVADLAVRPKDSDTDWVSLPALDMTDAAVDLGRHSASIDSLSLTGLKVLAWLEPGGAVNLLKLALPAAHPGAAPAAAPAATATASATATSPWTVNLREFAVREAQISAEDRTTQPAAKVLLAPLSLTVNGASLDMSKPVKVALDAKVNETGSLAVDGQITPQPLAATVKLKLAGIDLTAAQPYVAQRTALILRSGKLGGAVQVTYGVKPTLKLAGDLYVEKLHTVDAALHDDLINWERLDVRGIDLQQGPQQVMIAEIVARKPYARVIIEPDATLNVARVLKTPGAAEPASAETLPTAAAPAAGARRPKPKGSKAVTVKVVEVKPAPAQPSSPMAIKKIRLRRGGSISRIFRSNRISRPVCAVSKGRCSDSPRTPTRAPRWICTATSSNSHRYRSPGRSMC